jgi:antibiotic biosynthesis monooxygenase (ABM) superfamily enzyme
MKTKSVMILRAFECLPDWEENFNDWYCKIHVPMLLNSGEIKEVTRFRRIDSDGNYPKYVVIYQFENLQALERFEASPEVAAAIEDSKKRWPPGSWETKWRVKYEAVEVWKR